MITRRKTRTITVGNVNIGSEHPVAVQSMAKTDTADVDATVNQINDLENAGCEIARVAVKHIEAAKAIGRIKERTNIPIVADIHFDHKLAVEAIGQGVDKIRINPGNITEKNGLDRVIQAAADKGVPVRIGVNSGSLPENPAGHDRVADAMVSLALRHAEIFRKKNFEDIIISLKASDVVTTVKAYRAIAAEVDFPLHLGVTAAGIPADGIVRSSVGIGALLLEGIGDTIRVSLTGDPVCEVETARRMLTAVGLRSFGPQVISCPTCGRCQVDLVGIVTELERELRGVRKEPLVIAVMGCEVNGPGEAKSADIGIAFGRGTGVIFQHGKAIKTVSADRAIEELLALIKDEG